MMLRPRPRPHLSALLPLLVLLLLLPPHGTAFTILHPDPHHAATPNPPNPNPSIFWDDASPESIQRKCNLAESQLRAYIYPIPGEAGKADLKQHVLTHFQLESSYYHFLLQENTTSHSITLTSSPTAANAFFIDHHMIHLNGQHGAQGCQQVYTHLRSIIENVVDKQPYYNKSGGSDHFFFSVYDHGPFCHLICDKDAQYGQRIFDLMWRIRGANFIGNHGQDELTLGDHQSHVKRPVGQNGTDVWVACHRVGQDIVVPQLMNQHSLGFRSKYVHTGVLFRPYDSSFAGSLWGDRDPTLRIMSKYRHIDFHVYKTENFFFDISGGSADVDLTPRSIIMWHTCGFACWSQRLFHAMAVSTVPLIVNSGTLQPFEKFIDWRKISAKMSKETFFDETARRKFRAKLRIEIDDYRAKLLAFMASQAWNAETNGTGPGSWKAMSVPDSENLMSMYDNEYRVVRNESDAAFQALRNTTIWRKKELLEQAAAWFDLSLKIDQARQPAVSAYKLLSLEIWCRVVKDNNEALCQRPSNFTGRLEFVV